MKTVFIFNGKNSRFPSAVFSTKEKAEGWVNSNGLTGTITEMPLDMSTYDHALKEGLFTPKNIKEKSKEFIAGFSSRLWHGHYGEDWE